MKGMKLAREGLFEICGGFDLGLCAIEGLSSKRCVVVVEPMLGEQSEGLDEEVGLALDAGSKLEGLVDVEDIAVGGLGLQLLGDLGPDEEQLEEVIGAQWGGEQGAGGAQSGLAGAEQGVDVLLREGMAFADVGEQQEVALQLGQRMPCWVEVLGGLADGECVERVVPALHALDAAHPFEGARVLSDHVQGDALLPRAVAAEGLDGGLVEEALEAGACVGEAGVAEVA